MGTDSCGMTSSPTPVKHRRRLTPGSGAAFSLSHGDLADAISALWQVLGDLKQLTCIKNRLLLHAGTHHAA